MFLGEYEYKIDEKGRVPVPPKFRKDLKDGLVLSAGPEQCVVGYGLTEWTKVAESFSSEGLERSKMRRLRRAFFGSAFSLTLDGQGRIALPVPLRQYAQIGEELVIVGAYNFFELWNREQWAAEKAVSMQQAWQIIEGLEKR